MGRAVSERPVLDISLDDVLAVGRLLADLPAPWFVSGGWAIDLFLGRVTRKHEDLEIGVARDDQALLHPQLSGWELVKIVPSPDETSAELVSWTAGERLELPIHQIVARRAGFSPPEFEFFLNQIADGQWRFRRDESIRRPLAESIVVTPSGIPALAPELQLLYKARHHRPKDEHDFATALPHLNPARRDWLRDTLRRVHPGDAWLAMLAVGD